MASSLIHDGFSAYGTLAGFSVLIL